MSLVIKNIKQDLNRVIDPKKAAKSPKFYKAFKGGYGEGDLFIGVANPHLHAIGKKHYDQISKDILNDLLLDPVHEVRLLAVFVLVRKYQKAKKNPAFQEEWVGFYLSRLKGINNWDLVDSSAYKILGDWLLNKNREILYTLADSKKLWQERIAMVATMAFIKKGDFKDAFILAEKLLQHPQDIMHKAVGWMLKEIGKKDQIQLKVFLQIHYKNMPRTTLRYAIEKFDEGLRKNYLNGDV